MPSWTSWRRLCSDLLSERLDQLVDTLADLKQRLRQTLVDLLNQFVTQTVRDTVNSALMPWLRPVTSARYPPPHSPWWAAPEVPGVWPLTSEWEPDEQKYDPLPAAPCASAQRHLAQAAEIGCDAAAFCLKGWSRSWPVPAALAAGLIAAVASYLTQPWLGAGLALAASGLRLWQLVLPTHGHG